MQNQWWTWSCVYNKENYNEILNQIWQYLRMIPYISNTRWAAIFELMFRELTNIKDGKVDFYKEKLRQVFPSAFFVFCSLARGISLLFQIRKTYVDYANAESCVIWTISIGSKVLKRSSVL